MQTLRPRRLRRMLFVVSVSAISASLVAPVPAALAAISPTNDATALAGAMVAQNAPAGLVTGASFAPGTPPPSGTPNAVSDTTLAQYPSNGSTYTILTTGDANLAPTPNNAPNSSASDGGGNVRGTTDFDVSILRIGLNVPASANCLSLDFRFFSEEFPEYKGSTYNDAFIAELDTSTWATNASTITGLSNDFALDQDGNPISINSLGETRVNAANAVGTTYDGATFPLVATTPITGGSHTLFLSIFDQGDSQYDSAVFLDNLAVGHVNDPQDCAPGARQEISGLSLETVGSATSPTGVRKIGLNQIPLGRVTQQTDATQTAPFGKAPFGKAPFGKAPFGKAPFGKAPFGKAPFGKAPFGKAPFGKAPLSEYPLLRDGGWQAVLAQTCDFAAATPQSVTWQQLWNQALVCPTVPAPLDPASSQAIRLEEILIGASPLADFPLLGYLLGNARWSDVNRGTSPWSSEFVEANGCAEALVGEEIAVSVARGCRLEETSLPVRRISDLSAPAATAFWDMTISELNVGQSFLGDIAVSSIPAATRADVVNCAQINCAGATLRDVANSVPSAGAAGAWAVDGAGQATGTFADLGAALGGATLSDLVIAFVDPRAVPFESTSLSELGFERLAGGDNPTNYVTYDLTMSVRCSDGPGLQAGVTLPEGFRYRPNSTVLAAGGGVLTGFSNPTIDGSTLSWNIPNVATICGVTVVGLIPVQLRFDVMTGFRMGTFGATASASSASAAVVSLEDQAPVQVTESFEPGGADTPANATTIASDSMVLGQLSGPNDVDYYGFDVPVGQSLTVSLSHLASDAQLVLYGPDGSDRTQSLRPDTTPALVPVGTQPQLDPSAVATSTLPPPALQDIPFAAGKVLAGISDFRGTDPEYISTVAVAGAGGSTRYVAQVSGANGANSNESYSVIARTSPPPQLPTCPARTFPVAATSGSLPTVGPLVDTLILVDRSRLQAAFGATEANEVMASLTTLTNSSVNGMNAVLVPLDASASVNSAFAAWDADPCAPEKANDVVRAINSVVDSLKTSGGTNGNDNLANIENVLVVGEGDIIPHANIPDGTADGNESGFVGDTIFSGNANHLTGAAAHQYFPSDAPYASFVPLSVQGQVVYLPQAALGRLGGSPADIVSAVDGFLASGGTADPRTASTEPRTAYVSDYDFLSDGGDLIAGSLGDQVGANNVRRLSSPPDASSPWTRQQFAEQMASPAHVISPNAHFDQHRMLPAEGSATNDHSDVYSTSDLPPSLTERILFSIGCHFGTDFPDAIGGSAPTAGEQARLLDWQQALAQRNAAVMVGNLGYGIGDTATVGFGETLLAEFAAGLDGTRSVGGSLLDAQRSYFSSMPSFTPYDLKVLQEIQLWGMPMYEVPSSGSSSSNDLPATGVATGIPGVSGQQITVQPGFQQRLTDEDQPRLFFANAGSTQATHPYPIVPKVVTDIPSMDGMVAHGAAPLDWHSISPVAIGPSTAAGGYAFANATYDGSDVEDAPAFDSVYPTTFGNVGTWYDGAGEPHQKLVVLTGQYRAGTVGDPQFGTFRKYTQGDWMVTYSNDTTDFLPPTFSRVIVTQNSATSSTIEAHVTDELGSVGRVFVQALKGNAYTAVELPSVGNGVFRATGVGFVPDEVTAFAIDDHGNVGTANNGGPGFVAQPPQPDPDVDLEISGPQTNGVFTGPVDITVTPNTYEVNVDGGARVVHQILGFTGDGVHTARAFAPQSSSPVATRQFTIDRTAPAISIAYPVAASPLPLYVQGAKVKTSFVCTDATGIGSCVDDRGQPSGGFLDTSTLGTHTMTVYARDSAGHVSSSSRQYRVVKFGGFFTPIDNLPTVNSAKAGSAVPVKYRLTDENGVGISDGSTFVSVTAVTVSGSSCNGSTDAIETYAGTSGLQYNGDGNWQYNWATKKNYTGKCFTMSLNLYDGTPAGFPARTASFAFK